MYQSKHQREMIKQQNESCIHNTYLFGLLHCFIFTHTLLSAQNIKSKDYLMS